MLTDQSSLKGKVSLDSVLTRVGLHSSYFTTGRGGCGCPAGSSGEKREEVNEVFELSLHVFTSEIRNIVSRDMHSIERTTSIQFCFAGK